MLDFINDIFNVLKTLQLKDIFLDILPLTVIIYLLLRLIRETRAAQLLKGIALLIIVWALSDLADLKAIHFLADRCHRCHLPAGAAPHSGALRSVHIQHHPHGIR